MESRKVLLVFLLDSSGSMASVERDTIDGVNDFITKNNPTSERCAPEIKGVVGDVKIGIITFSSKCSWAHPKWDLEGAHNFYDIDRCPHLVIKGDSITDEIQDTYCYYNPTGSTALYDAIGYAVEETKKFIEMNRDYEPHLVIQTDGDDTASKTYYPSDVSALFSKGVINSEFCISTILQDVQKGGWKIFYIGSCHDVTRATEMLGISEASALRYDPDLSTPALHAMSSAMTRAISGGRAEFTQEERQASAILPRRIRFDSGFRVPTLSGDTSGDTPHHDPHVDPHVDMDGDIV
jgi:uncharacterized protein YegL